MEDMLSLAEAAGQLGIGPSRARALAAAGALPAAKIGKQWVIDPAAVAERNRIAHGAGRPFEPKNAWGLLSLASGEEPEWLEPKVSWRLRQSLKLGGLGGLIPRLGRRARIEIFQAHPGEIKHVLRDPALVRSGVSASASLGLDLVSGAEADGYVRESEVERFKREHALRNSWLGEANVIVRVVPDEHWHLPAGSEAPAAAVAVDLAEDPDPRSHQAGESLLNRLERAWA
jgi:hypothetical protein